MTGNTHQPGPVPGPTPTESLPQNATDAIRRVWGYETLRPLQAAAINAALDRHDALTVLPTGGGKSLCYQVPPLVTGKATLVISPLVALMRDQVSALTLSGVPAAARHADVPFAQAPNTPPAVPEGQTLLLYAAPERALGSAFAAFVAKLADSQRLGAIAIDEAHCISQWGHDFRPEYRRIKELRAVAPSAPLHAFTATATPRVRGDIARQLELRDPRILVGSFDRPNLTYRVKPRLPARGKHEHQIAGAIHALNARGEGGGAIVYCLSRKDTETIAEELQNHNIDAEPYHAGLPPKERHNIEQRFTNESLPVVVATVAFGMGIDRSNVRLVVHATCPKSVEAYQQEAGRAGRDGLPAECLLLYSPSDRGRWTRLITRSAEEYGADPAATAAQIELVNQMNALAGAYACRHKQLAEHFGQTYEHDSCDACDVCLGETQPEANSTRLCQIILSAVARTGERFGPPYITSLLKGDRSDERLREEHLKLKVAGMLAPRTKKEITALIDQLIAHRALAIEPPGSLRFGPLGIPAMKAEHHITLAKPMLPAKPAKQRRNRAEPRPLEPADKDLFESLRALRKSIADDNEVPPYVVFSDATLRELARTRPASRTAMLEIKGIGRQKLEHFGDTFLNAIKDHHNTTA